MHKKLQGVDGRRFRLDAATIIVLTPPLLPKMSTIAVNAHAVRVLGRIGTLHSAQANPTGVRVFGSFRDEFHTTLIVRTEPKHVDTA